MVFDGLLKDSLGTDYILSISPPVGVTTSHVSIAPATGLLTISADIVPDDSGIYTVTATGQDNYDGTTTATFELDVTAAAVSISYSPAALTASYDIAIGGLNPTVTPTDAANNVTYSISPNLKNDTGLDFDTNTGKISGKPSSLHSKNKIYGKHYRQGWHEV